MKTSVDQLKFTLPAYAVLHQKPLTPISFGELPTQIGDWLSNVFDEPIMTQYRADQPDKHPYCYRRTFYFYPAGHHPGRQ